MPTGDADPSGHLVLSHFGTCKCSNVETNISWTCLVSGLLSFEHPSVPLFFASLPDHITRMQIYWQIKEKWSVSLKLPLRRLPLVLPTGCPIPRGLWIDVTFPGLENSYHQILRGFHRTFVTGKQRTHSLPVTWSCPTWVLHVFYVKTSVSRTCLGSGLWISNNPRYFYFTISYLYRVKRLIRMSLNTSRTWYNVN